MGHLMVPMQGGSILYVYTKFELDSSFRSKVISGVPNFASPQTRFHGWWDGHNLINKDWTCKDKDEDQAYNDQDKDMD